MMLTFSKPDISDLPAMTALYREFLNDGDDVERYLREGFEQPGHAGAKCEEGGRLVGVFTARPGVEFTCGHLELVREIESRWGTGSVYTVDMIVVLPEYRGEGAARQLARNLRLELLEKGVSYLVIEEWRRSNEGDVPASGVIKYFGKAIPLGYFPKFYSRLHEFGMTCPECGEICRCGAYVCVIDLREVDEI